MCCIHKCAYNMYPDSPDPQTVNTQRTHGLPFILIISHSRPAWLALHFEMALEPATGSREPELVRPTETSHLKLSRQKSGGVPGVNVRPESHHRTFRILQCVVGITILHNQVKGSHSKLKGLEAMGAGSCQPDAIHMVHRLKQR